MPVLMALGSVKVGCEFHQDHLKHRGHLLGCHPYVLDYRFYYCFYVERIMKMMMFCLTTVKGLLEKRGFKTT
jgi:hypothetical protein